jgi:hypothetical protein
MSMPIAKRRSRGKKPIRAIATLRQPTHNTPAGVKVKGCTRFSSRRVELVEQTGLANEYRELRCLLDALHADGEYSGPRHSALCEAVSVTLQALQSVRRAIEETRESFHVR